MASYYREQLEDFLKTIEIKAEKVIDIGGGQLPVKGRTKKWDVGEYVITDLSKPHVKNIEPKFKFDIQKSRLPLKDEFDIAFMLEVTEYLYDPLSAFKNISAMLKRQGILFVSFPFIYPIHPPHNLDLLRYTRYGATKLLTEAGFKIERIDPRYIKNTDSWSNLFASEKWRWDRQENTNILKEAGSIITAKKL